MYVTSAPNLSLQSHLLNARAATIGQRITISGGAVVSAEPRSDRHPFFAAAIHSSGPDRGLTRNGEVRIHGVIVEEIEDLLELARGVA